MDPYDEDLLRIVDNDEDSPHLSLPTLDYKIDTDMIKTSTENDESSELNDLDDHSFMFDCCESEEELDCFTMRDEELERRLRSMTEGIEVVKSRKRSSRRIRRKSSSRRKRRCSSPGAAHRGEPTSSIVPEESTQRLQEASLDQAYQDTLRNLALSMKRSAFSRIRVIEYGITSELGISYFTG